MANLGIWTAQVAPSKKPKRPLKGYAGRAGGDSPAYPSLHLASIMPMIWHGDCISPFRTNVRTYSVCYTWHENCISIPLCLFFGHCLLFGQLALAWSLLHIVDTRLAAKDSPSCVGYVLHGLAYMPGEILQRFQGLICGMALATLLD